MTPKLWAMGQQPLEFIDWWKAV